MYENIHLLFIWRQSKMCNKAEFGQILMDSFFKLKKCCIELTPNFQDNELYIFKLGAPKLNILKF